MSMSVSGPGSQPMVVSGASKAMAPQATPEVSAGNQAAAPTMDFASLLTSLLANLGTSATGTTGSNFNTYA